MKITIPSSPVFNEMGLGITNYTTDAYGYQFFLVNLWLIFFND